MICKIADLIVEVPTAGGLASRCEEYELHTNHSAEIVIRSEEYRTEKYSSSYQPEMIAYLESAVQFYSYLLAFNGFLLHASAVSVDNKAYLFTGNSGVGKSTHAYLWNELFGAKARVINDDKPALRCIDGVWYAYGTPWCGKDGINLNERAPVAGVCFMKQAQENHIRRLEPAEALQKILGQTLHKFHRVERLGQLMSLLDNFLQVIPVYELENRPEPEAALLSHATMLAGAEQAGL